MAPGSTNDRSVHLTLGPQGGANKESQGVDLGNTVSHQKSGMLHILLDS